MQWKQPKNTDKYYWTQHVSEKMHFYGLSEQKILGVIRNPLRTETGIVENTVAVMMPVGNIKKGKSKSRWGRPSFGNNIVEIEDEFGIRKSALAGASARQVSSAEETWNQEIWVMYQFRDSGAISKTQDTNNKKDLIKNLNNLPKEKAKKLTKLTPKKLVIISAWRYPGVSPQNNPIPEDILREIEGII